MDQQNQKQDVIQLQHELVVELVAKPIEPPSQVESDEFLIQNYVKWVGRNKYTSNEVETGFKIFAAFIGEFENNPSTALLAASTTLGILAEKLCSMKIYADHKDFAKIVVGDELKKMEKYTGSAYASEEEDSASDFGAEDEAEDGDDNSDDGDDGDVKINENKDKEDNDDVACVETPTKKVKFSDL
jgi:hypothetical protein